MACRISGGLLEKKNCGTSMRRDEEKLLQNFQFYGLIIFFVRISNGVTHFRRISGQDVTTFFLAIPWVKFTSLEIPEGVFKKTRPQPLCLSFFSLEYPYPKFLLLRPVVPGGFGGFQTEEHGGDRSVKQSIV